MFWSIQSSLATLFVLIVLMSTSVVCSDDIGHHHLDSSLTQGLRPMVNELFDLDPSNEIRKAVDEDLSNSKYFDKALNIITSKLSGKLGQLVLILKLFLSLASTIGIQNSYIDAQRIANEFFALSVSPNLEQRTSAPSFDEIKTICSPFLRAYQCVQTSIRFFVDYFFNLDKTVDFLYDRFVAFFLHLKALWLDEDKQSLILAGAAVIALNAVTNHNDEANRSAPIAAPTAH